MKKLFPVLALSLALGACAQMGKDNITLAEQGSFTVGGRYVTAAGTFKPENFTAPDGQRAYGDFAYVKF